MNVIILTHVIIHSLKHSRKAGMIIKIYLSKDFDSLCSKYIQKCYMPLASTPLGLDG